jgi:hypothetical protein
MPSTRSSCSQRTNTQSQNKKTINTSSAKGQACQNKKRGRGGKSSNIPNKRIRTQEGNNPDSEESKKAKGNRPNTKGNPTNTRNASNGIEDVEEDEDINISQVNVTMDNFKSQLEKWSIHQLCQVLKKKKKPIPIVFHPRLKISWPFSRRTTSRAN